jgi:hypothetical protein
MSLVTPLTNTYLICSPQPYSIAQDNGLCGPINITNMILIYTHRPCNMARGNGLLGPHIGYYYIFILFPTGHVARFWVTGFVTLQDITNTF